MKHALTLSFLALSSAFAVACTAPNEDPSEQTAATTDEDPIVGGVKAAEGAWPATVAIMDDGEQACGGTLVAPTWVMTAAHCLSAPKTTNGGLEKVIVGRNKLSGAGGEEIDVVRAIRHPDYYGPRHIADVALLELATPSKAPVAKLLPASKARATYRANVKMTVVGWGVTSTKTEASSDVLLQAEVPFISQASCKKFSAYAMLQDVQFCAGYLKGGTDSCQGDSGGPIYAKVSGEWLQAGIVSWGIGCADAKAPGVYTRITEYLEWIAETQATPAPEAEPVAEPAASN